jgi:hypothetical protein
MRCALLAIAIWFSSATATAQLGTALGEPIEIPRAPREYAASNAAARGPIGIDPEIRALRGDQPRLRAPVTFRRSFANAFGGFGFGTAAGLLSGLALAAALCGDGFCFGADMIGAGIGAAVLAPLGAGLGVWAFGDLHGGTGNAVAAIAGAYLAGGLAVALGWGIAFLNPLVAIIMGPISGALLITVGAAVGYDISQGGGSSERETAFVVPLITMPERGEGLVLGAMGSF